MKDEARMEAENRVVEKARLGPLHNEKKRKEWEEIEEERKVAMIRIANNITDIEKRANMEKKWLHQVTDHPRFEQWTQGKRPGKEGNGKE